MNRSPWDPYPTLVTAEIFESPKNLPDMSFGLDDRAQNVKLLATYKALSGYRELGRYEATTLHTAHDPYSSNDFIFAEADGLLTYLVRIAEVPLIGDRRVVTQVSLWRDAARSPERIASHVFWTYLFTRYGAIMTDNAQTRLGRRFWAARVADALTRSLLVYLLDTAALTATPIGSIDGYERAVERAYGSGDRHKDLRLLIADRPLSDAFKLIESNKRFNPNHWL